MVRTYAELQRDLRQVQRTVNLAAAIPAFLRDRVTAVRAEEEIQKALEHREENFLKLAETRIYENPASPYRKLLSMAGCEYADLKENVLRHGLESTLERLAREGVYFTTNEYKGKQEVVRGGASFRVCPEDFVRAGPIRGFLIQSSGTTNAPISSITELDRFAEEPFEMALLFSAHNLYSYCHAVYDGILPVAGGVKYLLIYTKLGVPVDRWFAQKVPVNSRAEGWYHYLTTHVIVATAKWCQRGVPGPEFVAIPEIQRIVDWVSARNKRGIACCIKTAASNAHRIAQAAWERGISLQGTRFIVGGEPFTDAKREVIERSGAKAIGRYSFGGGGNVGVGCVNPLYTDEMHVGEHRLALIRQPQPLVVDGPPIHPLLFTTLSSRYKRFLLNVANGDYAQLEKRVCGCALEKVGLKLHLHHIRSYEKFTSEGMNYFYGDLFELFEKVLPAEFGGGAGDYQLVEEEDDQGQTRLSLVVNPSVRDLDEERLLSRLRAALSQGSRGNRFMTELWQGVGIFRVVRKTPYASGRGKILPLQIRH
jgi:hypothetical protein